MAEANFTEANRTMEISVPLLDEITEAFRQTIFNQHQLLAVAKHQIGIKNTDIMEGLTISIDRFNDDLFQTMLRLQDLLEAERQQ